MISRIRLLFCIFLIPLFTLRSTELSLPFPDNMKAETTDPRGDDFPGLENPEGEKKSEIGQETEISGSEKNSPRDKKVSQPKDISGPISGEEKQFPDQNKTGQPDQKQTKLPNENPALNSKKEIRKKNKPDKSNPDLMSPSYLRGSHQLHRQNKSKAQMEYSDASGREGISTGKGKLEQVRLLGLDGKAEEGKQLALSMEDEELKFQSLYELARTLAGLPDKDRKISEEIVSIYLAIITESPRQNPLFQKSLWAISLQLFKMKEFRPALSHLSELILNFKDSDLYDDAIYLTGRIYQEPGDVRDIERAKRMYEIFLKNMDKENFRKSNFRDDVKEKLIEISL